MRSIVGDDFYAYAHIGVFCFPKEKYALLPQHYYKYNFLST